MVKNDFDINKDMIDQLKEAFHKSTEVNEGLAKTYLNILKTGDEIKRNQIATNLGKKGQTIQNVGNNIQTLLNEGYLLGLGKSGNKNKFLPINPNVLYYIIIARKIHGSFSESFSKEGFYRSIKNNRDNLVRLWNENFLQNPFESELVIDSASEEVAWANFCGWMDNFKADIKDVRIFTPDLKLANDDIRHTILAESLTDFKGSFHVYTVTDKENELKNLKEKFNNNFQKITFQGHIVSEDYYFNKYFRVATIGDVLGTITLKLKQGSKYTGPLFYKQEDEIKYINDCFKSMENTSTKI